MIKGIFSLKFGEPTHPATKKAEFCNANAENSAS